MEEFKNITTYDVDNKLSARYLWTNRLISISLLGGPFFFLMVILFLYQINYSSNLELTSAVKGDRFIFIFLIVAVVGYSGFLIVPKIFLKNNILIKYLLVASFGKGKNVVDDPVIKLILIDRIFMIIRLAALEGITLFGLVILMLCVANKNIYSNNSLWILILPWFIQLLFTLNNYMTKEKTIARIESNLIIPLKNM